MLDVYQTSQEKLSSRSETVIFADQQVTWKMLFDIGAYARGSRINEQSSVKDIAEMTIHGDILRNYLSSTVLNSEQAEKIKAILYATSIEPEQLQLFLMISMLCQQIYHPLPSELKREHKEQ